MVNSREKGEHNSTQINTKIAFTHDLLGGHPECFELNEGLAEALIEMQSGRYAKAESIVDRVVTDCRYLVTKKDKEIQSPTITGNVIEKILGNNVAIISFSSSFFLIMSVGFFLLYKKT